MEQINLPILSQYKSPNQIGLSHEENISSFLNRLFPEQEYKDKAIKRTVAILGDLAQKLSVDEIQTIMVETEYLCETVLDTYERHMFKGKTLQELLNEG